MNIFIWKRGWLLIFRYFESEKTSHDTPKGLFSSDGGTRRLFITEIFTSLTPTPTSNIK